MIRIVIDAMGGDNAPKAIIEGSINALQKHYANPGELVLVGPDDSITEILREKGADDLGISCVNAKQVITMHESPVEALRRKPDSTILKALGMLKEEQADAMISAGNTGAVVAGSMFYLGLLKGIRRPGIGVLFSTLKGLCTIIDVGANIHCKPLHLFHYGWLAANYMKNVIGTEHPRIAMINIGEEDEKGTALQRDTHALFEKSPLNFVGNLEAQDLFSGKCDVVVCDGFVGNVILKLSEGLGAYLQTALTTRMNEEAQNAEEISLWQKVLKNIISKIDYAEHGAAPLLGVNGTVYISHGRSGPLAISNAIRAARIAVEHKVKEHLADGLAEA